MKKLNQNKNLRVHYNGTQELLHMQFCKYGCGTYVGFLADVKSLDGLKSVPIEVKTSKVHECPKRGWSEYVRCIRCGNEICFHNSETSSITGKKYPFDSPKKRHQCRFFTKSGGDIN